MKIILRILVTLFLIPGFLFDSCIAIAIVTERGPDSKIGEWAFDQLQLLPDWGFPLFYCSMMLAAIPVGLVTLAITIGGTIALVYFAMCTAKAVLYFPLTGKWEWNLNWL
jgi:hypothetical protein